jgi:hypothetical protein
LFLGILVISLIHVPITLIYSGYEGMNGLASLSYGNLGFSSTQCQVSPVNDVQELKCPTGLISEIVDFGITTVFED